MEKIRPKQGKPCLYIAYLSVAISLFSIAIAIILSEWFNIMNNALSDFFLLQASPFRAGVQCVKVRPSSGKAILF